MSDLPKVKEQVNNRTEIQAEVCQTPEPMLLTTLPDFLALLTLF